MIKDKRVRKVRIVDQRKRYFANFDALLDTSNHGTLWLKNPQVAELVASAIHHRDRKQYNLFAYCVMPNHVHLVFSLDAVAQRGSSPYNLTDILENLKWYTAKEANKILRRKGSFWLHESYDHVVRSASELRRAVAYLLNNPVKAGFANSWEEWKWTYIRRDLDI
jgi:REP element-mobilizing transposase RayT